MSNTISFTVPGRPVPATRMSRRGRSLKRSAQRYLAYKNSVKGVAQGALKEPFNGPVGVEIWAYIAGGRRPGDTDNLGKALLDGMNGIIYFDDIQVVDLIVHRRTGKPQRAEIRVWTIDEPA